MTSILQDLSALSSAEEILDYFAVPYDRAVVNVSRLHILKRFQQYLGQRGGLDALPVASAYSTCRELLARAYTDFLESSGIEQRVFKVFQTQAGEQRVSVSQIGRRMGRDAA